MRILIFIVPCERSSWSKSAKVTFAHRGERQKVNGSTSSPTGKRVFICPLPFTPYPFPHFS